MFRLISSNGREYLIQAASEGELQLWSASIASVIRETESKERVSLNIVNDAVQSVRTVPLILHCQGSGLRL